MAHDAEADRDLLEQAALAGGEIALKHYQKDVKVYEKSPELGPVTAADLEINQMLNDRLRPARPGYGWLSEEDEDGTERLGKDRVFIIDPIDGTRAFIEGAPGFSVAIAVAERGRVTAAAVYLPAREEMYIAALGHGARKNGAPMAVSAPNDIQDATVLTSRWQMDPQHWPGGVPPLERHFRSSLAWRTCLVAEGRFDAMLTFRDAFEWDIAAGALIAEEAGGCVTTGMGAPLIFNSPEAKQPGVIVAAPGLHGRIMSHRAPGD